MRRALIALFLAVCIPAAALAAELPAPVRALLLAAAPTHLDTRRDQLPAGARAAHTSLANAGEPFQVTDVIMPGRELPAQRIVWGVRAGDYYVLQTEAGGIAHSFTVEVYDARRPASRRLWQTYAGRPLPRFADFQAALRAGRLVWTQ